MTGPADMFLPRGEEGQSKRVVLTSPCASLMALGIPATTPAMADMATALEATDLSADDHAEILTFLTPITIHIVSPEVFQ